VRKDEGTDFFPYISLGGPIIKDRIWFFGSYAPQFINVDRRYGLYPSAASGRDPATRQFVSTNTYSYRKRMNMLLAVLTFSRSHGFD
jgi:hypothetical protein